MRKTCRTCGVEKDEANFYIHDKAKGSRKPDCIACFKEKQKNRYHTDPAVRQRAIDNAAAWQKKNPEKTKQYRKNNQQKYHLRERFGMTVEDWHHQLLMQSGRCAICLDPMEKPAVDHCHDTGAVRGLLCKDCNTGMGHLGDDPGRLRAAALYLEASRG